MFSSDSESSSVNTASISGRFPVSDIKELRQRQVGSSLKAQLPDLRAKLSDIILQPRFLGTPNLEPLTQRHLIAPAIGKAIRLETFRLRGSLSGLIPIRFLDASYLRECREEYYADPMRILVADNTATPRLASEKLELATAAGLYLPELGFAANLAIENSVSREKTPHDAMIAHQIVDYINYGVAAFQHMRDHDF